ncbi:MAG: MFS transporter [Alphaproteobacteria bacterium]|nr:MFS transporter [Alphaproteobacteria bacterium]
MNKYNYIASTLGYIFECYNNVLFGFFAVTLAPIFFPENRYALLSSFGAFAAGYLTRPIGGTIFGYIGDKYGRRTALMFSVLLAAFPCFFIALLPSYKSIGIFAPILLILARLLQGISNGGDYSVTIIYIAEQKTKSKEFLTCIVVASGFLGGIVGASIAALFSLDIFPEDAWRFTFLLGGLMSIAIFLLRQKMDESNAFKAAQSFDLEQEKITKPTIQALLASCILGGANLVPIYIAIVFINKILLNDLGVDQTLIFANNSILLVIGLFLVLATSALMKRFGSEKIMLISMSYFIVLSVPVFYFCFYPPLSLFKIFLLQLFIILGDAPQIAALTYYIPRCFPAKSRCRSLGISFTMGQALLGGTTPMLCWLFIDILEFKWAPSLLLVFSSILYILAIVATNKHLYTVD